MVVAAYLFFLQHLILAAFTDTRHCFYGVLGASFHVTSSLYHV
jgi:hypothetical protein